MKLLFESWRKFLKEEEAIEKLYKALGEDQQKIFKALTVEQQLDLARQWEQSGMPGSLLSEAITIDIDVGDIVLGGKYKNKRMVVKEMGKDELGQPTVNGKPILKFRTEKHLPDNKKSKKTLDTEKEKLDEAKVPKSVLKTLRTWSKKHGKSLLNFKRSDYKAADMGFVKMGETNPNIYHLSDLGREVLAANPPEEKVQEQESGLPPGFQGFEVEEPDEPVGSTAGMREIERNFGTYASESQASRYLKPAALALLKRYGDGRESIQIYEKGNVLGWAVELSKVTDASTAKIIGQKIKRNLWGKRSPKLTSKQWHLHDLPMWVAYDEGAERIEAPKPPPPRQGTLFENWRKHLKEAYYGGIPDEPDTPAGYGGAMDKAKVQRQLADEIDDLVKQGSLNPEDLSIEAVRANQEIPWDRYEAIDDEVLGDIIRDYKRKRRFYR